jgi:hypothetical protein
MLQDGMTVQTAFSRAEFTAKEASARRERFLARIEAVIPWGPLVAVIVPH